MGVQAVGINRVFNGRSWQPVQSTAMAAHGCALVCLPLAAPQVALQQSIYRLAYEQARALRMPPRYLRRFFSVWN